MKYEVTTAAAKRIAGALRSTERPFNYEEVLAAVRAEELYHPAARVLDLYRVLLTVDAPVANYIAQAAINQAHRYREQLRTVSAALDAVREFDNNCGLNQPEETK